MRGRRPVGEGFKGSVRSPHSESPTITCTPSWFCGVEEILPTVLQVPLVALEQPQLLPAPSQGIPDVSVTTSQPRLWPKAPAPR